MIEAAAPTPGGEPPALRLPDPGRLFEARAARLAELAPANAAPEWLRLLSRVAAGQARAVREVRPSALLAGAPLSGGDLPRDDSWRRMLALVVAEARGPGLPAATQDALGWLSRAAPEELDGLARDVLQGAVGPERLALVPFAGAALQAHFAALAAGFESGGVAPGASSCPVCGGPPVAGRVRAGDRLRYVTCAVCASEWNVPRVRCVACDTSAGPEYFHVPAEPGAKAEACPSCRSYLKLFDEEKRPGAEPAADDAATLALDLLLAEEGFHRAGPNLYVGFGA